MTDATDNRVRARTVRLTLSNADMNEIMSALDWKREGLEERFSGAELREMDFDYERMHALAQKIHAARRRM